MASWSRHSISAEVLTLRQTEGNAKRKGRPGIQAGAVLPYEACSQKNCSGSTPLLVFGFLLSLMLRVGALRWVFLGNVLWGVVLALLCRQRITSRIRGIHWPGWLLRALLLFAAKFLSFAIHTRSFI